MFITLSTYHYFKEQQGDESKLSLKDITLFPVSLKKPLKTSNHIKIPRLQFLQTRYSLNIMNYNSTANLFLV